MKYKFSTLFIACLALLTGKYFAVKKCTEKYIIVMDAGSTGSRVYVYKYDEKYPLETIAEVAHMRVHPALSTFVNDSAGLTLQIEELVDFAMTSTPSSSWSSTSICLKATAGLRSIGLDDQNFLISTTAAVLRASAFLFDESKTKVISGEEEALFDILAVTALFQSYKEGFITLGAADMGGSSQQIAFLFSQSQNVSHVEPKRIWGMRGENFTTQKKFDQGADDVLLEISEPKNSKSCTSDWQISIPGTNEVVEIYSKSLEFMGVIAAMETVLIEFYSNKSSSVHFPALLTEGIGFETTIGSSDAIISSEQNPDTCSSGLCKSLLHPCLPDGAFPTVPGLDDYQQPFYGHGDFDRCHQLLRDIMVPLAQSAVSLDCIKQYRPKVMIGMDNFPKVLEVLGIPQGLSVAPLEIRRLATIACRRPWGDIQAEYPTFLPYRAQRACFTASYVYTMLVDVYGIEEDDKEAFIPVDTVGEHELSWALGAAVFSAMNLEIL
jgi:GDA1/CD39 (nucleoside phosphatase) family